MAQVQYYGTGRRKNSVARVRLVPGNGSITINGRSAEQYIPFANLREVMVQPFNVTETLGNYDVLVNVNGGGFSGQSGAIRLFFRCPTFLLLLYIASDFFSLLFPYKPYFRL